MSKVALITGGAQGIGMAISLKLASKGYNLAINVRSADPDDKRGENVVQLARQFGVEAEIFPCDVSDYDAVKKMVDDIADRFGRVDVVVNSAGINDDGLIARMSEEQFDKVVDVNLKGTFNVCRHASRIFLKQKSGKIINITSVVGVGGNAGQTNYAAAKAGVIGLTQTLAKELGSRGITSNAVAPGFIKSHMTDKLADSIKNHIMLGISMKRFGEPEEVASLVAFLASDEANYINGQVIRIDGCMLI